jgi:hypothetical protein
LILLFNHIPKTGGHTVAKALSATFEPLYDYTADASPEAFERWRRHPVAAARVRDSMVLLGHFTGEGCRPGERYPALVRDPRVKLTTWLRNPTELALSSFFYRRRLGECVDSNFRDALFEMVGIYAHAFSITSEADDITGALWSYSFVGITEQMTLSCLLLAEHLQVDLPVCAIGHENRTERMCYPAGWMDAVSAFNEAARLDHLVYRVARRHLSSGSTGCRVG